MTATFLCLDSTFSVHEIVPFRGRLWRFLELYLAVKTWDRQILLLVFSLESKLGQNLTVFVADGNSVE